jgi:hypothetical protein
VTSRDPATSARTSASSASRPMKLDTGAGRLLRTVVCVATSPRLLVEAYANHTSQKAAGVHNQTAQTSYVRGCPSTQPQHPTPAPSPSRPDSYCNTASQHPGGPPCEPPGASWVNSSFMF